jgi:predicted ferric reductase
MKKAALPIIALLTPVPAWFLYFGSDFSHILEPFSLSMFIGLAAYSYFLVTLFISSRIRIFDRIYGHDRVMKFHSYLAITSVVLAIAHRQVKIMVFPFTTLQVIFGVVALLMVVAISGITILVMVPNIIHRIRVMDRFRRFANGSLKLDYSILKIVHNFLVLAVLSASIHVFLASSTQETWTRMIYIAGLAVIALGSWVRHKIIRPIQNRRKGFTIGEIIRHSADVTEVRVAPPARGNGSERASGGIMKYRAGQFGFFSFPGSPLGNEEHPFTFSSSPSDGQLGFTAKNLGDFSSRLGELSVGDPVAMDGPYGVFTPVPREGKKLVFIAGGIGITPFISILRDIAAGNADADIMLLWAVRTPGDAVYHELLTGLEEKIRGFVYIPLYSDEMPEELSGQMRKGFVDESAIRETVGSDISRASVYFCGPPAMRLALFPALKRLGVKRANIHFEQFSL